jgi:hypothetical protein
VAIFRGSMQDSFLKRLNAIRDHVATTRHIFQIFIALTILVIISIFASMLVPSDPVHIEWESIYFLSLTLVITIATLYLWIWLSNTQFLLLIVTEKKKLTQKKEKGKRLSARLIRTILLWILIASSVALLAIALVRHDYLALSISFVSFATAAFAYFVLRAANDTTSIDSVDETPDSQLYELFDSGYLFLPKRIRAGVSENLYLLLFLAQPQSLVRSDSDVNDDRKHFRVTLDAAGVLIAGENPRNYSAKSPSLFDYWNCNFPTNGSQLINLRIDLVKERESKRTVESVFVLEHYVRVTSLLRETWQPVLVLVPALITSISLVLTIFK